MTKREQETVINYNRAEEEASIYTCDAAMIRMLDKLRAKHGAIAVKRSDKYSKTYICPKTWIKIKSPRRLSEQYRRELAERARKNFDN